jgi:uncharacterized protein YggE
MEAVMPSPLRVCSSLGATVTLIALAGCSSSPTRSAPAAAGASASTSAETRVVSTRGLGTVTGTPDTLDLVLGVEVSAPTAAAALSADNAKAAGLIASLTKGGVAKKDIQTADLSISPTYAPKSQQVTGYQVSNTVRATFHNLTTAGAVIDAAAAAAGDAIRVQQVSFSIDDDSALLAKARVMAVQQAKTQASAMAQAAGVALGAVQSIAEVTTGYSPTTYSATASAAASPVPLEAGSQQLSVSVDVSYSLG